jgi:hypothetical protein
MLLEAAFRELLLGELAGGSFKPGSGLSGAFEDSQ